MNVLCPSRCRPLGRWKSKTLKPQLAKLDTGNVSKTQQISTHQVKEFKIKQTGTAAKNSKHIEWKLNKVLRALSQGQGGKSQQLSQNQRHLNFDSPAQRTGLLKESTRRSSRYRRELRKTTKAKMLPTRSVERRWWNHNSETHTASRYREEGARLEIRKFLNVQAKPNLQMSRTVEKFAR